MLLSSIVFRFCYQDGKSMRRGWSFAILCVVVLQIALVSCTTADQQKKTEQPAQTTQPAAQSLSAGEPKSGGELVISYSGGTPRHFNPALVSGSSTAIVGTQIFASPLRYDENWNPQPYLAHSWEVAQDGLSVTLHLVEDATFHDGQPVTSEDVAFSLQTVKQYHPFKSMFAPLDTVETPDPHTVVIRLSQPHPAILLAMSPALLPILPKHVYGDGQDLPTHPANMAPVGSGPFRFVEYKPDETIRLERYEGYFLPGRPYLESLVIRLTPDESAQLVDLQRQEAHMLVIFTNLDALDQLNESPHLVITQKGYEAIGAINWLAFNHLREPLNDQRVRQAIAYAVDPDFIVDHLHDGRTQRVNSPISPGSPFYDPSLPDYRVDLERANELLDQAGYPVQPDGRRFALTLDYIPLLSGQFSDTALYLERQLARVGIVVEVRKSADFAEWAQRIGNWDFDLTLDIVYNWGDPVIGVHRTYMCDNIRQGVVWSNTQNYCNPHIDELLRQAGSEMDFDKRSALYREFQQIVTAELPIFWINNPPYTTVYHRGLGNPPVSIWGVHSPLDEVYWRELPDRQYAALPVLEADSLALKRVGVEAMQMLQEMGLYDALPLLEDSEAGLLDLAETGLHIVGFTRLGVVFLDNSGQLKPGMDISSILDLEGKPVMPRLVQAADGQNDGIVELPGVWPHPATHEVGPLTTWCGVLSEQDVVCALTWAEDQGGGE